MFSKTPNSKGSFFKRASSWKDKHSKQKTGNSGSTPEAGRLHKATSLNDVSFQLSKSSRVSDEASGIIGISFNKIRLDDEISSGAATASPGIDSFNSYHQSPSSSKGAKAFTGRSIPRPTFKSHLVEDSQTLKFNQELQIAVQQRSVKSPEKRYVSSKTSVDYPSSQIPFNQLSKRSPGDGMNLTKKPPVSVRFSTGSNSTRSSRRQPDPPNLCVGCHGPLQTPKNQLGNNTPQADRSTSIKSPVFARHSTGNAVRTSQSKNDSSPKNCISCHSPLQTPTNCSLGDASEGLSFNKSRVSVRSSPGEASRSPQKQPGTSAVYSPGKQHTLYYQLKNPSEADGSNPNRISTRSSGKRQGTPHTTTSTQQSSADSRRGFPVYDPTEQDSFESFDDYDVLKEATRVLTSLQLDVTQSLDSVSDLPSGVVRRSSGRGITASNSPLEVPQNLSIDSLPSTYETRLTIVEACQTRCLEYREMIKSIAESILEKTKRFDSSTVASLASLYESFVQLKVNCSDFKEMCAKGGSSGDARADGNLSNEMTLFVQMLCLNTMQMQNEVYLERLQTGFALIRAHCKLFRFVEACSCFIRD